MSSAFALLLGSIKILIAADSKELEVWPDGTERERVVCKIQIVSGAAVSVVGKVNYKDDIVAFDAEQIARQAFSSNASLSARADVFHGVVIGKLKEFMDRFRQVNNATYDTFIGKPILEMVAGGYENGNMALVSQSYLLGVNGTIIPTTPKPDLFVDTGKDPGAEMWKLFGEHDRAERTVRQASVTSELAPDFIRGLVQSEFGRTVGPPISVLEIKGGKLNWIGDAGRCGGQGANGKAKNASKGK